MLVVFAGNFYIRIYSKVFIQKILLRIFLVEITVMDIYISFLEIKFKFLIYYFNIWILKKVNNVNNKSVKLKKVFFFL